MNYQIIGLFLITFDVGGTAREQNTMTTTCSDHDKVYMLSVANTVLHRSFVSERNDALSALNTGPARVLVSETFCF